MGPRISSKVRTSLDFSISSWALNFLPDLSSGLDPQIVLISVIDHQLRSDLANSEFFSDGLEWHFQFCAPAVEGD